MMYENSFYELETEPWPPCQQEACFIQNVDPW